MSPPSNDQTQQPPNSADLLSSPLADILYITKPIPLKPSSGTNSLVLKYEELYGPTEAILRKDLENITNKKNPYSELTPNRRHIVAAAKSSNNKENSQLSDTVSCTESMWEPPAVAAAAATSPNRSQQSTVDNNFKTPPSSTVSSSDSSLCIGSSKSRLGPSPTRFQIRNEFRDQNLVPESLASTRKRFGQSPSRDQTVARSISPAKIPSIQIQSPRHELTAGDVADSMASRKRNRNTPARPVIDVVAGTSSFLPQHQQRSPVRSPQQRQQQQPQTPSPNNSPLSFTTSPRLCSSSKRGEGASQRRLHVVDDDRPRSISPPSLSTQCSSQCSGSTNDLARGRQPPEISSLKSSHAELCWESVKLRKSSTKNFTIKNTSHRKLSMKMDIIGPGFQV